MSAGKDNGVSIALCFDETLAPLVVGVRAREWVSRRVEADASVKDAIERMGVPHTEIAGVRAQDVWLSPAATIPKDARLTVVGALRWKDVPRSGRWSKPLEGWAPRFVLDVHLGALTRRMRLLGFDCVYERDAGDARLAAIAHEEDRALLSRDRGLLKRKAVERGHLLRSTDPLEQVEEVITRFDLASRIDPFLRCPRCNGRVEPTDPSRIADRVEPGVLRDFDELYRCRSCGQPYWKGSHYDRIVEWIEGLGRR